MKLSVKLLLLTAFVFLIAAGALLWAYRTPGGTPPRVGWPAASARSHATWMWGGGHRYVETDNTTFLYTEIGDSADHPLGVLLKQRVVGRQDPEGECCATHITVEGKPDTGSPWTIQSDANSGEIFGRFYRTTEGGCCGSAIRDRYFDLKTGQQRFSATIPLAEFSVIEGGDALARYFAVDELNDPGDHSFAAKLEYGDAGSQARVIYMIADQLADVTGLAFLQDGKLTEAARLFPHGGAYPQEFTIAPPGYPQTPAVSTHTITGFSLILAMSNADKVTIPVVDDRPVFEKAQLPNGFRLSTTPPKEFEGR